MKSANFSEIAARYERDSLIQKSAAEKLLALVEIGRDDVVLDLGCGTGNLTRKIRALTDRRVVGVDPSEGMIREAEDNRGGSDITYEVKSAEDLDYRAEFTVITCNSVFQWFRDPLRALNNCYPALQRNGRMGIQAPAGKEYCPNFLAAMHDIAHDPRTEKIFSGFRSPWIFLETADAYSSFFQQAGFTVPFSLIEKITSFHTHEEAVTIFESGAAAGYLNQEFYEASIDEAYVGAFRQIIRESFRRQANEKGQVKLTFNRIFLLAVKGK